MIARGRSRAEAFCLAAVVSDETSRDHAGDQLLRRGCFCARLVSSSVGSLRRARIWKQSIQHSTFNIQHSTFNIQHSTFNIQHSGFSISREEGPVLESGMLDFESLSS
jgi:hypothetical protein